MTWIFTGLLLGSIVTSSHDSREACEGRATLLKEKGVNGKCVEINQYGVIIGSPYNGSNGSIQFLPGINGR